MLLRLFFSFCFLIFSRFFSILAILLRSEEKIITAHVIISLTAAIIIEIIMIVGIIMNLMKLAVCVNATIQ